MPDCAKGRWDSYWPVHDSRLWIVLLARKAVVVVAEGGGDLVIRDVARELGPCPASRSKRAPDHQREAGR
jgi:hypothetical protein